MEKADNLTGLSAAFMWLHNPTENRQITTDKSSQTRARTHTLQPPPRRFKPSGWCVSHIRWAPNSENRQEGTILVSRVDSQWSVEAQSSDLRQKPSDKRRQMSVLPEQHSIFRKKRWEQMLSSYVICGSIRNRSWKFTNAKQTHSQIFDRFLQTVWTVLGNLNKNTKKVSKRTFLLSLYSEAECGGNNRSEKQSEGSSYSRFDLSLILQAQALWEHEQHKKHTNSLIMCTTTFSRKSILWVNCVSVHLHLLFTNKQTELFFNFRSCYFCKVGLFFYEKILFYFSFFQWSYKAVREDLSVDWFSKADEFWLNWKLKAHGPVRVLQVSGLSERNGSIFFFLFCPAKEQTDWSWEPFVMIVIFTMGVV